MDAVDTSIDLTEINQPQHLSVEELTDLMAALKKVQAVLAEDYAYRQQY